MKQPEDLIWQSKSGKRLRYFMLLGIRFVEICMASIIPSIIGLMLVFIRPNNRIMSIMCFLSFLAFAICNWMFWMRYAKQRTQRREFFIINGIAYIFYAIISYLMYEFSGAFMYSILFSNLRAFESFGILTPYSLVISHVVICILMVVCQMYSRKYYTRLLEKLAENGADEIEMDPWGHLVPIKDGKRVDILSVEEMHRQMEEERLEAAEILQEEIESAAEYLWDEGMTKGRGERITTVEIEDIDRDLSEGDFIAGVGTERDIDNYDTDELWEKHIYKGRTAGDKPVDNYDDEPEDMPDFFAINHYQGEENETLWSSDMHQGKKDTYEAVDIIEEEDEDGEGPDFLYYDGEGLWNNNMYQGQGKSLTRPDEKKEAKREFVEIPTENSKYDSDNLWDNITQGRGKKIEIEEEPVEVNLNTMSDYDADNLWDNPVQGKKK